MMQSPPPYVPFVEYALKALEHPPYMYVAKIAACCTMLFLTREDPEMLQKLCYKWAIRFAQDRSRLVGHIRKRASYCVSSPDHSLYLGRDATSLNEDTPRDSYPHQVSGDQPSVSDMRPSLCCCDPDKAVEHMLSILNTLVPMYFSCNWHRADYVIQINKEYEVYIRQYVLPMCAELAPEEGIDDSEHTPWLLPPHTYLESKEIISSFYTPTSTVAPHSCGGFPTSSDCPGGSVSKDDNGLPATRTVEGEGLGVDCPRKQRAVTQSVKSQHPIGNGDSLRPKCSPSTQKNGFADAMPSPFRSNPVLSSQAPRSPIKSTNTPIMSPNVMCARAFSATAVQGLRFLTLGNYRDAILSNTTGLVIVFHAKYSVKSNEAIEIFQKITEKRLLNPMPTIAVVYAVMEPELSSLYRVSWLPTIVYTPPLRRQAHPCRDTNSCVHRFSGRSHGKFPCSAFFDSKKHLDAGATGVDAGARARTASLKPEAKAPLCSTPTHSSPSRRCQSRVRNGPPPDEAGGTYFCGRNHASESMSPRSHETAEASSPCTAGPTRNKVREASPSDATEELVSSIEITMEACPHASFRNHGAAGDSVGNRVTTFHHEPTASTDSRPNSLSGPPDSSPEAAKPVASMPREINLSSVGEIGHGLTLDTPQNLNGGSSANTSCGSRSVRCNAELLEDYSSEAWRASFKDIFDNNDYVIYPLEGVQTVPSLVEWISSRGASVPRLRKMKHFFTRIKSINENKFKRYREMHSAVVTLRRLQGIKDDSDVTSTSTREGFNTRCQLTQPNVSPSRQPDQPLFIFLGGGMAAGKTTAVAALARSSWWENHKEHSVVVNADEFKLPLECEMFSPEAHIHSTRAAENLLVKAINQGRSVVFDGTMMWKPFVEQVVAMVRNAHRTLFKQGPGYDKKKEVEQYFLTDRARQPALPMPYKIIFLGITVDVETAVPRGFLRKFQTNRGVPISMQLRSFKLFAENFHAYVSTVDETTLYNNNVFVKLENGELPPVLAECNEKTNHKLVVHDEAAFQQFLRQRQLNENADNVTEIFPATHVAQ